MPELVSQFFARATDLGPAPAIVCPSEAASFDMIRHRSFGFAASFRARGIGEADRVLLVLPIGPDLYSAILGAWLVGATVVFPEPALGIRGLALASRMTGPKAVVTSGKYRWLCAMPALWGLKQIRPGCEALSEPEFSVSAEAPALISFTTGSTGTPKAIVRSHGFLAAQNAALSTVLDGAASERDLIGFPAFVLKNLVAGRCSVLPGQPVAGPMADPRRLADWIDEAGATRLLLPPAISQTLLEAGLPERVQTVFSGGGPVRPALFGAAYDRGHRLVAIYGSTEAEPIAVLDASELTASDLDQMRSGAGLLAGHPIPEIRLSVEDDEILVSGDHVNQGYLDPKRDAGIKLHRDGRVWHRTGDAGRLDDAGRLWLLGRWEDRVQTRTGRIYPFQLEERARTWPGVRDAALLGAPADTLFLSADPAKEREYQARAVALGLPDIRLLPSIPKDPRHGSKVNRRALLTQ